ncbi:hypothetical protein ENKNEFLB_02082 [Nocardioides aquaticus]|uniref:Uncharacterized protein n=1 Tax=Nocardioides aquaticus TaxID=160826 RepID=A0ABX8EGP4_9ACTN|nr:hypothetical protein [Nocardioides aquaticus]QVT79692.1 hypothetical protein ENKNEFLB_02082 [Nocardioides aquaticus]
MNPVIAPKPAPLTGPITLEEAIADINYRHLLVAPYGKATADLHEELHRVWFTLHKPRLARSTH